MKRILLFDKKNQTFLSLIFYIFFHSLFYSQNPPTCSGRWGPPIVNQTFGQGNNTNTWYGPLTTYAPGASTSTIFVGAAGPPGGSLEDGFSGLCKNSSTRSDFINSPDHTGNPNGLMMLINAPSTAATVFFEYVMDNLCANTTLKLSIWILNVNPPGTCGTGYQFPNVTLRAVDTVTGNVLGTTTTGDIPTSQTWTEYSIVFNNASSSSVRLQIVNNSVGNGCGNDLAIDDITVSPCIPSTIRAVPSSGTTLCPGQSSSVQFTATLTGSSYTPAEYQWQYSRDGGVTWEDQGQPTTNSNYTFSAAGLPPGSYQIRFKVGPRGSVLNSQCNAISEISTVISGSTPQAADATIRSCFIENDPSTASFNLSTAPVTSQTGTVKTYYPTFNDARNGTNEITSFTDYVAVHGSVVYVKVTDANGCFAIAKVTLEVIPPVKSPILTDKFICVEDTTTLDAGPGFASYLWSTGATTQSISNIGIGVYWVKLKTGNCITTQHVRVHAPPQPVIQSIDISDHTATINVTGGKPPYQYSVDGTTSWQDFNMFTKLSRGQHTFYVRDFYNCVPVAVEVTIPNLINAITPNGDHINDVIDYSALAYKNNLVFEIYDRYGNKLHEAGKLRNFSWNGTVYGKKVITGTYWYTISWTESDKNKTQIRYNGWVMVKNRD